MDGDDAQRDALFEEGGALLNDMIFNGTAKSESFKKPPRTCNAKIRAKNDATRT